MTAKRWLVIFVKDPVAGRVKTRLARGIGTVAAAWWFRHQVARLLRRLGQDRRWETVLAVAPNAALQSRMLPGRLPRIAQGSGNLGARMGRVLRDMPPGPVVIIGSDIPGIQASHIDAAFRALGRQDAVVGPAEDGGYWLIGLKRGGAACPANILRDVRWSSEHALVDTILSMRPLTVARIANLADVDHAKDLTPAEVRATVQE
ncbi:MAG: TIGR04282 family arsenosugar biosynthesis glycosyltransferase [Paracoccaceae bacterium]